MLFTLTHSIELHPWEYMDDLEGYDADCDAYPMGDEIDLDAWWLGRLDGMDLNADISEETPPPEILSGPLDSIVEPWGEHPSWDWVPIPFPF